MRGYSVEPGALSGLARRLNTGSTDLENSALPPAAPDAGVLTGSVAAVLGLLTQAVATVVEGVGAAGRAVTASDQTYSGHEGASADRFRPTE